MQMRLPETVYCLRPKATLHVCDFQPYCLELYKRLHLYVFVTKTYLPQLALVFELELARLIVFRRFVEIVVYLRFAFSDTKLSR